MPFPNPNSYAFFQDLASNDKIIDVLYSEINGGRCLGFAEMIHSRPAIKCSINIPKQILVIDSSKCPENDSYDRIHRRFRVIIDYIQNGNNNMVTAIASTDCDEDNMNTSAGGEQLVNEPVRKRKRHVTISTDDHEQIDYYLGPIEKLMKIDESYYHFYCLISKWGTEVELSMLSISIEHHCQFDCILSHPNSVEDSIAIIKQCGPKIAAISVDEQINLSLDVEHALVEINEYNILSIFNMLVNKHLGCDDEEDLYEMEEVTDHGMLKLSLDILRDEEEEEGEEGETTKGNATKNDSKWLTPQKKQTTKKDDPVDDMDDTGTGGSEEFTGDKILKMHDFFFVNSCKLMVSIEPSPSSIVQGTVRIPKPLAQLNMNKKNSLLDSIPK